MTALDFKTGGTVIHQLSDRAMIVLSTSSDNMVNCRYVDNNGQFQSQWFYPEELQNAPKNKRITPGIVDGNGHGQIVTGG